MAYGIPWQGSKNRLARWVVDRLPASHTLVDLFAGGCAVTHRALETGRFARVVANDLGVGPQVFERACRGEYEGWAVVRTKAEFEEHLGEDPAADLCHSFGNDRSTYLWGPEYEAVKVPGSKLVLGMGTVEERQRWYRQVVEAARAVAAGGLGRPGALEVVERTKRLRNCAKLQNVEAARSLRALGGACAADALEVTRLDYREVEVPEGATVYADPPYRGTNNRGHGGAFDFAAFDAWLAAVPFPVVVSEKERLPGCEVLASRESPQCMAAGGNTTRTELLQVQSRFAGEVRSRLEAERAR